MNVGSYQAASYVAPGGTKKEKERMKEQWVEYQLQHNTLRKSMNDIPEDPSLRTATATATSKTTPVSRARADSHSLPQSHLNTSQDADRPRRFSSAPLYNPTLLPTQSDPQQEIRRLSGNFNAPTHVEVERYEEHNSSSKVVGRLRRWENRVKGWVSS